MGKAIHQWKTTHTDQGLTKQSLNFFYVSSGIGKTIKLAIKQAIFITTTNCQQYLL
jgi:hypothetical protein